ncbi:MAG: creatininase family protein [Pirellulales bacterium]|nr:creatininase family protein [Pirellulales bacterium]
MPAAVAAPAPTEAGAAVYDEGGFCSLLSWSPALDPIAAKPWRLAEVAYGYVKEHPYELAVLPLGATEPHNLHLPYGTDTFEAEHLSDEACRAAWERGARVVLLPAIPYGTETNQMAFPLAMNLNPSTLHLVIRDLVDSLAHHGIRKVVLFNSHGGNDLKPLLRELYGKTPVHLFLFNWYHAVRDAYHQIFEHADDHAGEAETSLLLAWRPELVLRRPDGTLAADEGATLPTRFEAINRGWVNITRPWHLLTTNSGAGNPHAATAEKGRRLAALVAERLAAFLVELSHATLDERFPF